MAIQEELELDITGALDAIESLNEPLTQLGENLTTTLTNAIEAVDVTPLVDQLAELDASGLTTTIDAAVGASDGLVPIDADTSAVPEEINAAVDSADTTVPLEADVSDFGGSIDEALAAADATVVIEADVGDIAGLIEEEISSADTTVIIEADGSALTDLGADASGAVGGLEDAGGAISGLAGGLVGGDVIGGLTAGLGKAGPAGAAAAAGIGIFTGGVLALVGAGTDALASQQRFADTFGNLADQASRVKLGGLNADLGELAIRLGSDDEGLQDAASSLFQFGKAAGFTNPQALELVNNSAALAARAVALNPALGQVGDVAASISNAFARGGKFASKYGLSLTAAEINARALANTGKATAADLSIQDKAFAGSQIAAERYGDGLEKTINKGSKNAAIQQRSLAEQLQNVIEEAGKPLVAPFQDILREMLPVVKELIPVFAELAKAVLPVVLQVIKDNIPAIKLFGEIFRELSPIISPLIRASLLLVTPLTGLLSIFKGFDGLNVGGFFSGIGEAITGLFDDVVGFGSELIDNFLTGIQEAFPAVIGFFSSVGGTIVTAIGDFTTTLGQKAIDLVTGFLNGITTTAVAVFQFFTNLAGTIITTIGDVAGTLAQKGIDLVAGFLKKIKTTFTSVVDFVAGIPGRVVTAVGNVASTLFRAGVDMIQGLINGIVNKAGDIVGILKRQVTDRIPKFIKNALGIGSPSKVLMKIGEDIGDGLALGIEHSVPSITSASRSMIAAALPIPGVSNLPAVTAALPSAGVAAGTAGQLGSVGVNATGGTGDIQIIVNTTSPNPVDVGLETVRQLRAEQFRNGR